MKTEKQTTRWRFRFFPLLVLLVGVGVSSCYEDYGLTVADYDTYFTHFATGTNFQKYKYFFMPDTIVHVYDTTKTDPLKSARKYDKQILSLTASNLEGRGYARKLKSEIVGTMADSTLVVLVGQMSSTYVGYYYDYWYGYWGWYWPGYYPPYYPPMYGGTYEYTKGTNITEIIDWGQSKQLNKPVPVWTAVISGLTESTSTAPTRITDGVNRTFEQSPYLYSGQ